MRRLALGLLLLLLTGCAQFQAAACGGPDDPGADEHVVMPDKIAGLTVERDVESTKTLNQESTPDKTYQCPGSGRVYAMRDVKPLRERKDPDEKGELRAVLQISRLAPDARLDDIEFLRGLLKGPTGNVAQPLAVNCVDVYTATAAGNEQIVNMWFNGRYMFFLTVREDPTYPGQVVGVNIEDVLKESVMLGPPGYEPPDPASCPAAEFPTFTPTEAPSEEPTGSTTAVPTGTASPVEAPSETTTPAPGETTTAAATPSS